MRAEHLQQDWDSIEALFSGGTHSHDGTVTDFESIVNTSKRRRMDRVSDEGTGNLCRALCREIQLSKELIVQAENLNAKQREESMNEILHACPEESAQIR